MANLLTALNFEDAPRLPYLNTDSVIDLATGKFVPGTSGEMILNGGLAPTNGVIGRPKTFKSTFLTGAMVNTVTRYKDAVGIVYDSEHAIDKERLLKQQNRFMDDLEAREAYMRKGGQLDSQLSYMNDVICDLEGLYAKVKEIAEHKLKHKKDYVVESPFLDVVTGKPVMVWIPTLVAIDSLTMAKVDAVERNAAKFDFSDSKNNAYSMGAGRVKSMIMGSLTSLAVRHGIYFCISAQIGDIIDMSGNYGPPPKQMQYMKQGDKLKGVSPNFGVAISNLFEVRATAPLLNSDRSETKYPYAEGLTGMTEMTQLTAVLTSCKNNPAGCQLQPIVSQNNGPEIELTHFDYLKIYKDGLVNKDGNKAAESDPNPRLALLPDITLNRRQAWSKLCDYKTARAAQLLCQLIWIRQNWSYRSMPVPFDIDPLTISDALTKQSYAVDDILNSRGYWTYDKEDPRPYLSVFDMLSIITGDYKPKLHAVAPANVDTKKKAA